MNFSLTLLLAPSAGLSTSTADGNFFFSKSEDASANKICPAQVGVIQLQRAPLMQCGNERWMLIEHDLWGKSEQERDQSPEIISPFWLVICGALGGLILT